ncbi:MAG: metal-dependent hydrolase [Rubrobacter sp.]|nr:metal-dependent hydrolase [Rubrobacter sp.]
MNATTHAVFGVAAFAGASLFVGVEPPVWTYPAAVVAAWLPDADNPRSRLGNGLSKMKNPLLNAITRPISWLLQTASFILVRAVGHRTLTHSLLGLFLFALPIYFFLGAFPALQIALMSGAASHIVADALNTRGVPLLWPLGPTFRIIPGGFKSGGVIELAVAICVMAAAGYAIYLLHPLVRTTIGLVQPI